MFDFVCVRCVLSACAVRFGDEATPTGASREPVARARAQYNNQSYVPLSPATRAYHLRLL